MIRAIAAIDDKRGIASKGKIPWDIPTDSGYFRQQTEGATVVMGRDTYEEFALPLSNRRNIVVSRKLKTVRQGFELISDITTFLEQAKADVWVIGGAGLYESTLDYCDELYLTHVKGDFACDRFFPLYDQFALKTQLPSQQENGYEFSFAIYKKTGES